MYIYCTDLIHSCYTKQFVHVYILNGFSSQLLYEAVENEHLKVAVIVCKYKHHQPGKQQL